MLSIMILVLANNSTYTNIITYTYANYTSTIEEDRYDINLYSPISLLLILWGLNYIQSLDMTS